MNLKKTLLIAVAFLVLGMFLGELAHSRGAAIFGFASITDCTNCDPRCEDCPPPCPPPSDMNTIDKAEAQDWVSNWNEASKAIYFTPRIFDQIKNFNDLTENKPGNIYLYYGMDGNNRTKLILFKSEDGISATSKYYRVDRSSQDIIICPPICDFPSPLLVQNMCQCH